MGTVVVMTATGKACIGLLAGFWLAVLLGGMTTEGYTHYRHQVSLLSAVGVDSPWFGFLAVACACAAHLVVVPLLLGWDRVVGVAVGTARASLLVVMVFRVSCPPRVRFCEPSPVGVGDRIHTAAVVVYAVAMVLAMLVAGIRALVNGRPSIVGVPGLVAAAVFVMAFGGLLEPPHGLAQRTWIIVGQLWLVGAAFEAGESRRRVDARA